MLVTSYDPAAAAAAAAAVAPGGSPVQIPRATAKAAAAGAILAASPSVESMRLVLRPATETASPSSSPFPFPLGRSQTFRMCSPWTIISLREKKIIYKLPASKSVCDMDGPVKKKLAKVDPNKLITDNAVKEKVRNVAASIAKRAPGAKRENTKTSLPPTAAPRAIDDSEKQLIVSALCFVFNFSDTRLVTKSNLPLEHFSLASSPLYPNELGSILHISCQAMTTCIIPLLKERARGRPYPLDFAFCTLEEEALVPLIQALILDPEKPALRVSRPLTELEGEAMEKKVYDILRNLPMVLTRTAKYTLKSKECCEPIFFVSDPYVDRSLERKKSEQLTLEETFHSLCLEYMIHKNEKEIERGEVRNEVTTTARTALYMATGMVSESILHGTMDFELGVVTLLRTTKTRLSVEYHPTNLISRPVITEVPCPQPLPSSPSGSPFAGRKPLPPAPKGKKPAASSPLTAPGAESAVTPPPSLEQADRYLDQGQPDLAMREYENAQKEAEKRRDRGMISDCIRGRGRAYLAKREWIQGTKFLNSALALCLEDIPRRNILLNLMAEGEKRFLKEAFDVDVQIDPSQYLARREELKANRQALRQDISSSRFDIVEDTEMVLANYTQRSLNCSGKIWTDLISSLGKPPCAYTLLALGSGARGGKVAYSDDEFACEVAEDTEHNVRWYERAFIAYEMRKICLGETPLLSYCEGGVMISPTPTGECFDAGGNTPNGKTGYEKLIKSPNKLAESQSPTSASQDIILTNILRSPKLWIGSEALYASYLESMRTILNGMHESSSLSVRQMRACELIRGHLKQYQPKIDLSKQEFPIINVKEELSRLIILVAHALGDYLDIEETNTFKLLKVLERRGILPDKIRIALSYAMHLRACCQLHYGTECDLVFHESLRRNKEIFEEYKNPYFLTSKETRRVIEILRVLFPLHLYFTRHCQEKIDVEMLSKATFYEPTLFEQWALNESS